MSLLFAHLCVNLYFQTYQIIPPPGSSTVNIPEVFIITAFLHGFTLTHRKHSDTHMCIPHTYILYLSSPPCCGILVIFLSVSACCFWNAVILLLESHTTASIVASYHEKCFSFNFHVIHLSNTVIVIASVGPGLCYIFLCMQSSFVRTFQKFQSF